MHKVKVDKFEGPLDLLLDLIENEKLDITEISLAKITDSYLKEVSILDPKTYDVAEFMVVAARLIYLKSKAILPTLINETEETEIEDLRNKLEIYKKYKEAGKEFGNILSKNRRSFPSKAPKVKMKGFVAPKGVEIAGLYKIFQKLLTDMPEELKREEVALPGEKITVEEKLVHLKTIFTKKKKHNFSYILKQSGSKIEAIVTFLAILEMIKCKEIKAVQGANFTDIELVKR